MEDRKESIASTSGDGLPDFIDTSDIPNGDSYKGTGGGITEAVSWDSLLLAGFRSQVPLGFEGEEKQG
ncbi:hypothetical protein FQN60_012855, partial [Etheostoma spectabile]